MKNINVEFWSKIVVAIFAAGMLYAQVIGIRSDLERVEKSIDRLEIKVEKHNNFDRRIVALETMVQLFHEKEQNK